jgi:proton-translocating NADH-quinone oxidoreductase chain M
MNIALKGLVILSTIFFIFLNLYYWPFWLNYTDYMLNIFSNFFLFNYPNGSNWLISLFNFFSNEICIIHPLKILLFIIFSFIYFSKADLDNYSLRWCSLVISIIFFLISLIFFFEFDLFKFNFQFTSVIESKLNFFNFSWFFEIDGISLFFILLTTFITPICLLVSWEVVAYLRYFIICFFLIEFFLLVAFTTTNLLVFFIAFESILIPMFLIIGIWGTRFERIKAAYLFFLYTLVGSIFFLLNLISLQSTFGTFDFTFLQFSEQEMGFNSKIILWIFFFLSFSVKIPMFPFHIWLPEAHVEAPTSGSIMLASLLLKLGGYGFLRFSIGLFPQTSNFFLPLIVVLCFIGITYSSLITLRQLDLKRLIAYSSIAHMNYIVLGLFSFTYLGIVGGVLLMLGHGIVSSALFLLVGVLYDRHHVRLLSYYSGLVIVMPIFSLLFGFFTFTNMAFPGLANFPGELLILAGLVEANFVIALTSIFGLFLSAVYSVWLLNRLIFGSLKTLYTSTFNDISRREFYSISPLIFLTFVMGLIPNFFLESISFSTLSFLIRIL